MKKLITAFTLSFVSITAFAQFSITLETGAAFNGYNDVQAPNAPDNQGTRFSFTDDFTPKQPVPFVRAEASYLLNEKHRFALTAVPLTFDYEKNGNSLINFEDGFFGTNNVTGSYQFNTYRATYRYRLVNREKTKFELGLTGLLRDAKIELSEGGSTQKNTDLGFVPLVSFYLNQSLSPNLSAELSGDALVGPQGRAEDIFAGFRINLLQDRVQTKVGYRIIEGGADVDQVYNFSLFHFATVGLTVTL